MDEPYLNLSYWHGVVEATRRERNIAATSDLLESLAWILTTSVAFAAPIPLVVFLMRAGWSEAAAVVVLHLAIYGAPVGWLAMHSAMAGGTSGMRRRGLHFARSSGAPAGGLRCGARGLLGFLLFPDGLARLCLPFLGQRSWADAICGTRVFKWGAA